MGNLCDISDLGNTGDKSPLPNEKKKKKLQESKNLIFYFLY